MNSWKTTLAGITIIACVLSAVAGVSGLEVIPASWRPWLILCGAIGGGITTGVGFILSRDNDKSSEDVGAQPKDGSAQSAQKIPIWLLIGALAFSPVAFTGCNTPPTREAVIYYTFADTWTATHTAYQGWCERVVQGKVSKENEAAVDAAWNKFRAAFKLSFKAASLNWNAATPADVNQLSTELLTLIRTL